MARAPRLFRKFTAKVEDLDASDLQHQAERLGARPISGCRDREPATFFGTLRSVTIRPRAGVPTLEAELYDGSGSVTLVWLGRRAIGGIEPGRSLRVFGRPSRSPAGVTLYNPRYVLVARDG